MDWLDIILHAVAAAGMVGVLAVFGMNPWHAAIFNGVLWGVREFAQDWMKGYRPLYIWPIRRSTQKDWEFLAPLGVGFLVAGLVVMG